MPLLLNSISKKLFFALGLLVVNIVAVAVLALAFLGKAKAIHDVAQRIDDQRVNIVQLIRADLDILHFESVNPKFYETGVSTALAEREALWRSIKELNTALKKETADEGFTLQDGFIRIDSLTEAYDTAFRSLLTKVVERGFKDYGLEGAMRTYAHRLETTKSIPAEDYLMLRRHEKDFLLRKEIIYVEKFNTLADRVESGKAGAAARIVLDQYRVTFNELAELNHRIGFTPQEGLTAQLNLKTASLSEELAKLIVAAEQRAHEITRRTIAIFLVVTLVLILVSIMITFRTAVRLARPIKKLSRSMEKFSLEQHVSKNDFMVFDDTVELRNLSQTFLDLSMKLNSQYNEIQAQNEEIQAQNEEIHVQNEEIVSQNQELKKLNEELDRFIYSAAHDLKSPLASLEGLILLFRRDQGKSEEERDQYFRMMLGSVRKLEAFIRDITNYAQNKSRHVNVEKIDLRSDIQDIVDSLRFQPAPHGIDVRMSFYEECDLFNDRTRLGIVLKNLLSNSFRYVDHDKERNFIDVSVSITSTQLMVSVYDNGVGIEERHLSRIFDLFYRANEASTGTGIGLFLVKETIRMLGGAISVESEKDGWTKFVFAVPNLAKPLVDSEKPDNFHNRMHSLADVSIINRASRSMD